MATAEYEATPEEVRKFTLLQVGLTAGFLVLLFFMLGGTDADYPPVWLCIVLVALVGLGAFLAERVWLTADPLPAEADPDETQRAAVGVFAGQTVRKLVYCEAPLIIGVLTAFITDHGGWPIVVVGFPGLAVLLWETWPSIRNTSMTAVMLDSKGAQSGLVESFLA